MPIEDTRLTAQLSSIAELNKYLGEGWVLIVTYVKHTHDTQEPRFVVAWQKDEAPVFPDLLDEWEKREVRRSRDR